MSDYRDGPEYTFPVQPMSSLPEEDRCTCHVRFPSCPEHGSASTLGPNRHGTLSGYNTGCRCGDCREARALYDRGRHARYRPSRLSKLLPYVSHRPACDLRGNLEENTCTCGLAALRDELGLS